MAESRFHPIAAARRFASARQGATAVEFAIIALPFMLLLFGIIELACVFLVSATLDLASDRAARMIRTGEFQTGGSITKNDFKAQVCSRMTWLSSACAGNLTVDVQTFNNFTDLSGTEAVDPDDMAADTTCFTTGNPGDIVLVRTFFTWTIFTPLLDNALSNTGDGKRRIAAVTAFRNEPYSDDAAVGAKC